MNDENDRFGMPQSAFDAAWEAHGKNSPVYRCGMYVPTRAEVRDLPSDELWRIVIDWMWESPSELIPNNQQIASVRDILLGRKDASTDRVRSLVEECNNYLKI
jgi:hypothetical protein